MNSAYLPAVAALAGSAVGGLTSLVAAWLTQHREATARGLAQDKANRQELYKQFIEEASRLYADALVHDESEVADLISVYALMSTMRILSSSVILEKAETVVKIIVDTFSSPNKTFQELRDMMNSPAMDPLREFSEACREELRSLRSP